METRRVLLVEADPGNRHKFGMWLQESGYEVRTCPGPKSPDYTCVGGRRGECPLVEPADVVVLGLDLDSEIEEVGTSAFELLSLYTSSGKPVVVFGPDPGIANVFDPAVVTVVPWPPEARSLIRTVGDLLDANVA